MTTLGDDEIQTIPTGVTPLAQESDADGTDADSDGTDSDGTDSDGTDSDSDGADADGDDAAEIMLAIFDEFRITDYSDFEYDRYFGSENTAPFRFILNRLKAAIGRRPRFEPITIEMLAAYVRKKVGSPSAT